MERHRGRLAGKTPRCAGGCESSSTQGLVLSSAVIPICPPNGPMDYRSLLLFYGGVFKPLLHIPPDQASTAGSAAVMRAPDTRMSSRKTLSPERPLSSREHNPVPSPHFLSKNHPTFPSSKYLAWVLPPLLASLFPSLQHFGLKGSPQRTCCDPHTAQISEGGEESLKKKKVTPVPESLQHGTQQDKHSLSSHVYPGTEAGVSRMCHAVFNQVGLGVLAACLNMSPTSSPTGMPSPCQRSSLVKRFQISETVGQGLRTW